MKRGITTMVYLGLMGSTLSCSQTTAEEYTPPSSNKPQAPAVTKVQEEEKQFKGLQIVEIRGMKFIPTEITVSKGDTVVWINKDISIHDVADKKHGRWQSPHLNRRDHWKHVIYESTEYYCTLHKVMKGKITVR